MSDKLLWDVMYSALWQANINDIEDKALANCLILLKDYLVDMLEERKEC